MESRNDVANDALTKELSESAESKQVIEENAKPAPTPTVLAKSFVNEDSRKTLFGTAVMTRRENSNDTAAESLSKSTEQHSCPRDAANPDLELSRTDQERSNENIALGNNSDTNVNKPTRDETVQLTSLEPQGSSEDSIVASSNSLPIADYATKTAEGGSLDTVMIDAEQSVDGYKAEQPKKITNDPLKTEAVIDPGFLAAASVNKDDKSAEWQYDSSDDSTSDKSSESERESDLPDLNEVLRQIKASIGETSDAKAEESESTESESSDSESSVDLKAETDLFVEGSDDGMTTTQSVAQSKPPKTFNEENPMYRIPSIDVTPIMKISPLGTVAHIVPVYGTDSLQAVIQSKDSARVTALDHGTVLCREDRVVIGEVFETLGNVENPHYVLGFNSLKEMQDFGVDPGLLVYYVEDTAVRVFTDVLLRTRYTDASNLHDEEIDDAEIEFSDDEKEAAYKASQKQNKRKKNRKQDRRGSEKRHQDLDRPERDSGLWDARSKHERLQNNNGRGQSQRYSRGRSDRPYVNRPGEIHRESFGRNEDLMGSSDRLSTGKFPPARDSRYFSRDYREYPAPLHSQNGQLDNRDAIYGEQKLQSDDLDYGRPIELRDHFRPTAEPNPVNLARGQRGSPEGLERTGVRRWAPFDSAARSSYLGNGPNSSFGSLHSSVNPPNTGHSALESHPPNDIRVPDQDQRAYNGAQFGQSSTLPTSQSTYPGHFSQLPPLAQNQTGHSQHRSGLYQGQWHGESRTQPNIPGLSPVAQHHDIPPAAPDPALLEAIRQNFPHLLHNQNNPPNFQGGNPQQ